MNILLIWAIRLGAVFLTPLLIGLCMELHSMLPLVTLFVAGYCVAWKIDIDDQKRMNIKYKLQREVKRQLPSN